MFHRYRKTHNKNIICTPVIRTINSSVWYFCLLGVLLLLLTACDQAVYMNTPTFQVSNVDQYNHYAPSKKSVIRLSFDYPSYWFFFGEETEQYTGTVSIDLIDPAYLTVPTRAPNEPHGTPGDFGRVWICVRPVSDMTLNGIISMYRDARSGVTWIKQLKDYQVVVDGYDAQVLEYQIEPMGENNGYSSLMFERDVFFVVDDQIYQIVFIVAEKDRDGQFEKGFNYFFDSLRVILSNAS